MQSLPTRLLQQVRYQQNDGENRIRWNNFYTTALYKFHLFAEEPAKYFLSRWLLGKAEQKKNIKNK